MLATAKDSLAEQRLMIYGVTWERYEALRELLDESGVHLTYCEGALDASTGTYRLAERSQFLPELDLAVIAKLAMRPDLPQALRDLEQLLASV